MALRESDNGDSGCGKSDKPSNSNNLLIVFVEVQKGWKAELSYTSDYCQCVT